MRIYVKMKGAGRRRPVLDNVPYEISDRTGSLEELIRELVRIEVAAYSRREAGVQLIPFLTGEEITDRAAVGKVTFGRVGGTSEGCPDGRKADLKKAQENALQCYKDGLVRVFMGETELTELETPLQIAPETEVTFIRLTFLAGRLW